MNKHFLTFAISGILTFLSLNTLAQITHIEIVPQSQATYYPGQYYYADVFYYNNGTQVYPTSSDFQFFSWSVDHGEFSQQRFDRCEVKFTKTGTIYLYFYVQLNNGNTLYAPDVGVPISSLPAPNANFSTTQGCSGTTVTADRYPPSGRDWFWQTSLTGTSQTLGKVSPSTGQSITRTASGPLYLRSRTQDAPYVWGQAALAGNIQVIGAMTSAGSIGGGNRSVCLGKSPGIISPSSPAGGLSHTYQWQVSSNGSSWSNISGATNSSYTPPVLTQALTHHYRRRVISCGTTLYTNSIAVTGQDGVGNIDVSFSACGAGITSVPILAEFFGADYNLVYTFKWYHEQGDATPFRTTNIDLTVPGNYPQDGFTADNNEDYYLIVSSSDGCTTSRKQINVQVGECAPGGGQVSFDAWSCNEQELKIIVNPNGKLRKGGVEQSGTGTFTFPLTQANLNDTYQISRDGSVWTTINLLDKYQDVTAPAPEISILNGPFCPGSNVDVSVVHNFPGVVALISYHYYTSTDQFETSNNTFTLPYDADGYQVEYVVEDGNARVCKSEMGSVNLTGHVIPPMTSAGQITDGNRNVCLGNSPGVISPTAPTGGSNYSYQWQQSSDNQNWSPATEGSDPTGDTYTPPEVNTSGIMYYRRVVTSSCGATLESNSIPITGFSMDDKLEFTPPGCRNAVPFRLLVEMFADESLAYTFEWYDEVQNPLTTYSTSPGEYPQHAFDVENNKNYYVQVTSSDGCSTSLTPYSVQVENACSGGGFYYDAWSCNEQDLKISVRPSGMLRKDGGEPLSSPDDIFTFDLADINAEFQASPDGIIWTTIDVQEMYENLSVPAPTMSVVNPPYCSDYLIEIQQTETFTGAIALMEYIFYTDDGRISNGSNPVISVPYEASGYEAEYIIEADGERKCTSGRAFLLADPYIVDMEEEITLLTETVKCGTGEMTIEVEGAAAEYEWIIDGVLDPANTTNVNSVNLASLHTPVEIRVRGVINQGACGSDQLIFNLKATDNCENYIHIIDFTEGGYSQMPDIGTIPLEHKSEGWTYFDGLGRPYQSILQNNSPSGFDIIKPNKYDAYGRQPFGFLAYLINNKGDGLCDHNAMVNTGAVFTTETEYERYQTGNQWKFYQEATSFENNISYDPYPRAETIFEPSPLNRPLEQGAPGEAWQPGTGHTIRYSYLANAANEVALWEVDENGVLRIKNDQTWYDPSELIKNTTTDEEDNKVIEYTDKQGQTLLKKVQVEENPSETSHEGWACTYYVYDDFNQLRYVLPPQLIEEIRGIITTGYSPSTALLDQYAFQYKYDHRKRMTEKKVPGAGPVYMVYDNRDRLVLTQDGNQRLESKWTFTKYDALNRPIITGIYIHGSVMNQNEMQTHVNSRIASGNDFYEERNSAVSTHKYTNRTFPTSNTEILTVTYYDNYSFLEGGRFESGGPVFSYKSDVTTTIPYPATSNQQVKGQVTGSKVKVLDPQDGTKFLNTVTYYDDRYRVIQTITESNLGGREIMTNCYDDLTQNVKESVSTSEEPDPLTVRRTYSYDHAQRLLEIQHQLNAEDPVTIVSNHYNELGELIGKELNKTDESTSWQTVDFRYNIRGWLTHINDANLTDTNDLFGMELYYTDGFEVPYYNGNISGVKWKTAVDEDRVAYGYRYDKLNRITNAHYVKGEKRPDDTFEHAGRYNLEILPQGGNPSGYDLNGNILNLKRYGLSGGNPASPAAIDVLSYHYDGNQLTQVDDAGTQEGFKDGMNEGDDYEYDANGNMTIDRNKGIENITYNHLNLPMVIEMSESRKIEYIYDAAGIKLAQRVYEDDTQPATKTTDYIGERVYETKGGEDIKLQFLHHEEGRIVKGPEAGAPDWTPDAKEWEYQYHLKDHLGNARLTFGAGKTMEYLLTMEIDPIENRLLEADMFENVFESEDNKLPQINHTPVSPSTPNPEYVAFLNGVDRVIGPAKSLKVLPGDQVEIEAYAKYLHLENYNSSILGGALLSGFFGAFINAGSEFLINNGYVDEGLLTGLENLTNGGNDYTGVPQAYINYILFDKEYNIVEAKKLQISEEGKYEIGDTNLGPHEYLHIDPIAIAKEGYIYIYLSNQTPGSEVYFDDLMITHTQGRVVQKDDYYPFGLTFNTSGREGSLSNKYLYNGKERQELTGWDDYGKRMYDSEIGRWHVIDALSESLPSYTPYRYALNNPISYIDIGGYIEWPVKGNQAVNKKDYADGAWGLSNTVVRTSTYLDTDRPPGATNPHVGIDYRAIENTDFHSLGDGKVVAIGTQTKGNKAAQGAKYIIVEYSNGDRISFVHINSVADGIKVGDKVYEGQVLGKTGKTGTKHAHLHLTAKDKDGNQIDPEGRNYGKYTNKEFFETYGGDYTKLDGYIKDHSPETPESEPQQEAQVKETKKGISVTNVSSSFWSDFTYQLSRGYSDLYNWLKNGAR